MSSTRRINNVADARRLARRTLPRAVFDYIDGGAEDEVTMAENERAAATGDHPAWSARPRPVRTVRRQRAARGQAPQRAAAPGHGRRVRRATAPWARPPE